MNLAVQCWKQWERGTEKSRIYYLNRKLQTAFRTAFDWLPLQRGIDAEPREEEWDITLNTEETQTPLYSLQINFFQLESQQDAVPNQCMNDSATFRGIEFLKTFLSVLCFGKR